MKKRTSASIALIVLALSVGLVGNAAAAPLAGQAYQGNAYGTTATLGGLAQSGLSSFVALGGCAAPTPPGYSKSNTTATINISGVLTTGAIDTNVSTGPAGGPPSSTSSADIHDVNALSGLVSATEVKAVSATSFDSTGYHVSAAGSSLVGLSVLGVPILVAPAPNTTIKLPGVGHVVLNQQKTTMTSTGAGLTVNMIDITLSTAQFGLPAGTQIIVGHAYSGLAQHDNTIPTLQGAAFSAQAHVGTAVTLGQEFPVAFCGNTHGKPLTNGALTTSIPGILSSGTAANSVTGTIQKTTSTSVSTATIQNLNLLSGLVTADAITAEGNAAITGSAVTLDETGSTFTNLVVNGVSIPADVAPNTTISIGGLTVWLNRVIKTNNKITVRMIEITASAANTQGLPIGSDIQVASAMAGALPPIAN